MGQRTEKEILSRLEHHLQSEIDFRKKCMRDMDEFGGAKIKHENEKMIACLNGVLRIINMLRDGRI